MTLSRDVIQTFKLIRMQLSQILRLNTNNLQATVPKMKFPTLLTLFALLLTGLNANATGGASRQVIITYPQETSSQMLAEARYQIEKAVCFPSISATIRSLSLSFLRSPASE